MLTEHRMTMKSPSKPCSNGTEAAHQVTRRHAASVVATPENISTLLANDAKVKVAGVDSDGILRGKVMSKDNFLASIHRGFAMSPAVVSRDMHDEMYTTETHIASAEEGYSGLLAVPDLTTFRRLLFEDDLPFVLLSFGSQSDPVPACGRNMMKALCRRLSEAGCKGLAGVELEFMNFKTPTEDGYGSSSSGGTGNIATFLLQNTPKALRTLTNGLFGYSVTRPMMYKKYFHRMFDEAEKFGCSIEGWHTESGPGPGVTEAVSFGFSSSRQKKDD